MTAAVLCKCGKLPNVIWSDGPITRWKYLGDKANPLVSLECKTCVVHVSRIQDKFDQALALAINDWNREFSEVQP